MEERSRKRVKIIGFDGVFGMDHTEEDKVMDIELSELYEFKNHPFRVCDDKKMYDLAESIKTYGVLTPGIVRPRKGGGYEIISGHRRKRASEIAGKSKMPVFCKNYTDDEATVVMVDANLQREEIVPSEKAFAYKMKYEAMKRTKKRGDGRTLHNIGVQNGESQKTIQNYIWLTRLNSELMGMVDAGEIGIKQAVNLSFISIKGQEIIREILTENNCNISYGMSKRLREITEDEFTRDNVLKIINPAHATAKQEIRKDIHIDFTADEIKCFFPNDSSVEEIKESIIEMLNEKCGNGCHKSDTEKCGNGCHKSDTEKCGNGCHKSNKGKSQQDTNMKGE